MLSVSSRPESRRADRRDLPAVTCPDDLAPRLAEKLEATVIPVSAVRDLEFDAVIVVAPTTSPARATFMSQ
jgi:hypothetical protein